MKIKLKASFGGQFTGTYGDIVEMDEKSALNLIEKNLAELVEAEPPKLIPKIIKGKKSGK